MRLLLQKMRELVELVTETEPTEEIQDLIVEIEELIQEEEMYG